MYFKKVEKRYQSEWVNGCTYAWLDERMQGWIYMIGWRMNGWIIILIGWEQINQKIERGSLRWFDTELGSAASFCSILKKKTELDIILITFFSEKKNYSFFT